MIRKIINALWLLTAINWISLTQESDMWLRLMYILLAWVSILNYIEGEKYIAREEKYHANVFEK